MKSSYAGCWLSRLANTRTFCLSPAAAVSASGPSARVVYIHALKSARVKQERASISQLIMSALQSALWASVWREVLGGMQGVGFCSFRL